MKMGKKNPKGFTLIELIIVIAILAIIATVAVPRVTGVLKKARDNSNKANITIIKNALERYYAENGEYPADLNSLVPDYLTEVPEKIGDKKDEKGEWTKISFSYTLDTANKYTLE